MNTKRFFFFPGWLLSSSSSPSLLWCHVHHRPLEFSGFKIVTEKNKRIVDEMQLFKLTSQKWILNGHISLFNVESIHCSLDRYVAWYMLDIEQFDTEWNKCNRMVFPPDLKHFGQVVNVSSAFGSTVISAVWRARLWSAKSLVRSFFFFAFGAPVLLH